VIAFVTPAVQQASKQAYEQTRTRKQHGVLTSKFHHCTGSKTGENRVISRCSKTTSMKYINHVIDSLYVKAKQHQGNDWFKHHSLLQPTAAKVVNSSFSTI
jgi:hypothetical protein